MSFEPSRFLPRSSSLLLACALAFAPAAFSQIPSNQIKHALWLGGCYVDTDDNSPRGACDQNNSSTGVAVDFGSKNTLGGRRTWDSDRFTPIANDPSFLNLRRYNLILKPAMTDGICLDVSTGAATSNMDTRIWTNIANSWVSLGDDVDGTLYSRVHVWIKDASTATIQHILSVAAYSTSYNDGDFNVRIARLALNEANCTTDQLPQYDGAVHVYPWVAFKDNAVTFGGHN